MATFGFIGTGNMGGALAQAMCKTIDPANVYLNNRTMAKADALAVELGANTASAQEIATKCDFIMLGVKPHLMAGMLSTINATLEARTTPFVLVSMAAGLTLSDLDALTGTHHYPIIRTMPNTPCSIGAGIILYTVGQGVAQADVDTFLHGFSGAGFLSPIDEHLMGAGGVIAGCGPAFTDLYIEALADGGVCCGLPRKQAYDLACAMVIGSAKLIQASGRHPGDLKDAVCSPGGSTIQGVRALEAGGFRSTVIEAAIAANDRMDALAK